MLFERPLPSFTKNIIYIDRPSNHKTILEMICSIFFWKQLPSTRHTTIYRLCRFHLSYRGKYDKKSCLKYSIHCCFPAFFFRKPTQAHTSGFSHQSKIYRRCADKMPLYSWEVHVRFHCHLNFTEAEGWRKKEIGTKGGEQWSKRRRIEGVGQLIFPLPLPSPLTSNQTWPVHVE